MTRKKIGRYGRVVVKEVEYKGRCLKIDPDSSEVQCERERRHLGHCVGKWGEKMEKTYRFTGIVKNKG